MTERSRCPPPPSRRFAREVAIFQRLATAHAGSEEFSGAAAWVLEEALAG
ncbi:MAG: hypothetical protein AAF907_11685 [Planctomycetota bacterium]